MPRVASFSASPVYQRQPSDATMMPRPHHHHPMHGPPVTLLVANFSPEELANAETTRVRQAELDEYNGMHGVRQGPTSNALH